MKPLVVMGSAPCLLDDLVSLGRIKADYMAINRAGIVFRKNIKWWATYHSSLMSNERWLQRRCGGGGNMNFQVVLHQPHATIMKAHRDVAVVDGPRLTGSSTLFGVLYGLIELKKKRVVVVGAPLDHPHYEYFQDGWTAQKDILAGRVESLSGWTKKFLEGLK